MKMNRNVVHRIIELREQEYCFEDISKKLKISRTDVLQALMHHRPDLCKLLLSKQDVVIELTKEGKPTEEISDVTGLEDEVINCFVMQAEMSGTLLTQYEKDGVARIDTAPKKKKVKKRRKRSKRTDFHNRNMKIIEMREGGKSYQQIGDRYGITRERVRTIIKGERPDLLSRIVNEITEDTIKEVIRLREEGMTYDQIEAEVGLSSHRIAKLIKEFAPNLVGVACRSTERAKTREAMGKKVIELKRKVLYHSDIAKQLEISAGTVGRLLSEYAPELVRGTRCRGQARVERDRQLMEDFNNGVDLKVIAEKYGFLRVVNARNIVRDNAAKGSDT